MRYVFMRKIGTMLSVPIMLKLLNYPPWIIVVSATHRSERQRDKPRKVNKVINNGAHSVLHTTMFPSVCILVPRKISGSGVTCAIGRVRPQPLAPKGPADRPDITSTYKHFAFGNLTAV
jgi:hypothetical protein